MATYITDPHLEDRLKHERQDSGADRFDEVWESVLMMSPLADDEHQQLVLPLGSVFQIVMDWPGLGDVRAGVNVSDRTEGWTLNYRIPDVAVFLRETAAQNLGTHWVGGPDFAVEVLSPDDHSREKIPFYGAIGTRELLLVNRDPWSLELYRLQEGELVLEGTSSLSEGAQLLGSVVVPLSFRLLPGKTRPQIEVRRRDGDDNWLI